MVTDISARRAAFKQGIDKNQGRRLRHETKLSIRKNKKEQALIKRRMGNTAMDNDIDPSGEANNGSTAPIKKRPTVDDVPSFAHTISSQDSNVAQLLEAVKGIRRLLSVENDPPVDIVIQAGVIPYLVQYLTRTDSWLLMFEAAWALTNVASTTRTNVIVEAGAVPHLITLLRHVEPDLREQAAWCLGNIAGDSRASRDKVLEAGALEPLLLNVQNPASPALLGNVTWVISNLCRGKPGPDLYLIEAAIAPMAAILQHEGLDEKIQVDAAWALSYLSDGDNTKIQKVMDSGVTSGLAEKLKSFSSPLVTPCVRCIGNFITGSDSQTQAVLDVGIMEQMEMLLHSPKKSVRKEVCWVLSNIAAGTPEQIGTFLKRDRLVRALIDCAGRKSCWDVRKEAIWTISNVFTMGTEKQVEKMVQAEGLEAMCSILSCNDTKVVLVALDAIEKVLQHGEEQGKGAYAVLLDEYGGIDKIEDLQDHASDDVYEKVCHILDTYFGEDNCEDENLAPSTENGTFAFGMTNKQLDFSSGFSPQREPFSFGGGQTMAAPAFGTSSTTNMPFATNTGFPNRN